MKILLIVILMGVNAPRYSYRQSDDNLLEIILTETNLRKEIMQNAEMEIMLIHYKISAAISKQLAFDRLSDLEKLEKFEKSYRCSIEEEAKLAKAYIKEQERLADVNAEKEKGKIILDEEFFRSSNKIEERSEREQMEKKIVEISRREYDARKVNAAYYIGQFILLDSNEEGYRECILLEESELHVKILQEKENKEQLMKNLHRKILEEKEKAEQLMKCLGMQKAELRYKEVMQHMKQCLKEEKKDNEILEIDIAVREVLYKSEIKEIDRQYVAEIALSHRKWGLCGEILECLVKLKTGSKVIISDQEEAILALEEIYDIDLNIAYYCDKFDDYALAILVEKEKRMELRQEEPTAEIKKIMRDEAKHVVECKLLSPEDIARYRKCYEEACGQYIENFYSNYHIFKKKLNAHERNKKEHLMRKVEYNEWLGKRARALKSWQDDEMEMKKKLNFEKLEAQRREREQRHLMNMRMGLSTAQVQAELRQEAEDMDNYIAIAYLSESAHFNAIRSMEAGINQDHVLRLW